MVPPITNVLHCGVESRQRAWRLSSGWVRVRWTQLRAEAIERLQSSVWRLRATEMPTVRAHLAELVRFLSKLVGDPNFKISLTALHVCGALAEKADTSLAPHVSALLPALLHKLADAKPVVRQANLKVRRPSAQASSPLPPTLPALCCRGRKCARGWVCRVSTRTGRQARLVPGNSRSAVHAMVCKAAARSHLTEQQPAAVFAVLQVLTKLVSAVDAPVVLNSVLTAASASVRSLVAALSHHTRGLHAASALTATRAGCRRGRRRCMR